MSKLSTTLDSDSTQSKEQFETLIL